MIFDFILVDSHSQSRQKRFFGSIGQLTFMPPVFHGQYFRYTFFSLNFSFIVKPIRQILYLSLKVQLQHVTLSFFSFRYSSPVVPYPYSTTILCGKQNGGCHAGLPVWPLPEVALPRGKEVVPQSHNNYSTEWTVTSVVMAAFPMRPLLEVALFCVRK